MTKTTRTVAVISALLLSAVAAQASAATSRLSDADCAVPSYRNSWQDEDLTGAVKLAVLVDADGRVQETKVISSSGHAALDKASLRAGTSCKFKPASKDSGSAPVWAQVQYNWVLN